MAYIYFYGSVLVWDYGSSEQTFILEGIGGYRSERMLLCSQYVLDAKCLNRNTSILWYILQVL